MMEPSEELGASSSVPPPPESAPPSSHPPPRQRRFFSLVHPWSRPGLASRCAAKCCCCCASSAAANKILPVTVAPTDCDYLEIRPHRRIRVIHRYGLQKPSLPPPLYRTATTISRAGTRDESDGGPGDRYKLPLPADTDETSDEEEYWFENAAPTRAPIVQPPPGHGAAMQSRIFNKFEPQEPPRIPGINPPKASLANGSKLRDELGGTNSSSSSASSSPAAASGGQRLQRKVILPTDDIDLDDEDDLVREDPIEESEAPAEPPVVEDNFVASVLADMNGMMLNITADATDSKSVESEPQTRSMSPERSERSSSPLPDERSVESLPDPEIKEVFEDDSTATIVIVGGHLGGMANVAFEGEEEKDDEAKDETDTPENDSADAGYTRNRKLSDLLVPQEQDDATAILEEDQETEVLPPVEEPQHPPDHIPLQHINSANPHNNNLLPILFFIHGVGGSASTWSTQIEYFTSKGYEVVVPDLLGHGFSSSPDNEKCYTFNKLFRDLLTIFDHYIGDSRPCVVIAHSYGSSFAAALARTRPVVIMLLLLASGGPTPLAPPPAIKTLPSSLVTACLKPFLKCGFRRQKQYNPRGKSLKFQEAFDVPSYVFRHIMAGQTWPEGDASFHRRITIPTLLIYGLKDPFVSLVEMCEMERTIPKAYLELVPLAGHMIMLDQPRELNVMMRKFIEKYLNKLA